MKNFNNVGLFGSNTGKDWVSKYEKVLAKMFIEDDEFMETASSGFDTNIFNVVPELRLIVGTFREMVERDGVLATYDQLRAELYRKYSEDEIRMQMLDELLTEIQGLELGEEERSVYKNQFIDWGYFNMATKIMNLWADFIKSDIRNGDRTKMYAVMNKMKYLADQLPEVEIRRAPKEWN